MNSTRTSNMPRLTILISVATLAVSNAAAQNVNHVIHISVDGLRGDLIEDLVANDTMGDFANFQRLQDEGAITYNARTDVTHTNTLPNHTSILTGRPVFRPAAQPIDINHAYVDNGDPGPTWTLHNHGNPNLDYVPSIFDVAHDHGLSTGLYASKSKFIIYEQSYNDANGAEDITGDDNGRDKIDEYVNSSGGSPSNASSMQADFIASFSSNPLNYNFVHYRDPDSAGHDTSWGSSTWVQSVRDVDDYLGEIFAVLDGNPTLRDDTAIVLTSDHGGTGTGHGDTTNPMVYTIPVMVWGGNTPAATNLYDLYTARFDPGTAQPHYNDPQQPIRNGDTGSIALNFLGLPPISGSFMNFQSPPPAPNFTNIPPPDATIEYGDQLTPTDSLQADLEDSFDWYVILVEEGVDVDFTLRARSGDLVPNLNLYEGAVGEGSLASTLGTALLSSDNQDNRTLRLSYTPQFSGPMTLAVSTIAGEEGVYVLGGSGFQAVPEPSSVAIVALSMFAIWCTVRMRRR